MKLHALSFTAIFVLCGFSSCSSHLSDVCQSGFSGFERGFDTAELRLREQGARPARAIASIDDLKSHGVFTPEESEEWMNWAEANLKLTQHYMDLAEGDALPSGKSREVHEALTKLANEWVSFHGYGHAGRVPQMTSTLANIREYTREARALACETPAQSPAVTQR